MTTGSMLDRERLPGGLGRLAWGLCLVAEVMAAACVVLLLARRVPLGVAVDAYLVTNLGMVAAFGAIGGLVAGNRPGEPDRLAVPRPQPLLRGGHPGRDGRRRPPGRPVRRDPAALPIVFRACGP